MFCPHCASANDDAARFCVQCGRALPVAASAPGTGGAPPTSRIYSAPPDPSYPTPPPGAYDVAQYAVGKNPVIALILSLLIVGLGQFYNGDTKKGLIMLGAAIVGGLLTVGIVWILVAIWSAVDAYRVASGDGKLW